MTEQIDMFRAFRIEEDGDGKPRGNMTRIGLSDLGDGEILIRVDYSNLNYKDALAATGAGKIAKRLPIVGGIDVAGTVIESSEGSGFKPGDEVFVTGFGLSEDRDGGYAEYARLQADHTLKLPPGLDAEQAMALGTAGLTAALSVSRMEHNGLSPDMGPVAVTGATGGVGSLAVNMLSGLGYEVTAVTGKNQARGYLEDLDAGKVLIRQGPDQARAGDRGPSIGECPVGGGGGHCRRRDTRVAHPHGKEGRPDSSLRKRGRGEARDHRATLHLEGRGPSRYRFRLGGH